MISHIFHSPFKFYLPLLSHLLLQLFSHFSVTICQLSHSPSVTTTRLPLPSAIISHLLISHLPHPSYLTSLNRQHSPPSTVISHHLQPSSPTSLTRHFSLPSPFISNLPQPSTLTSLTRHFSPPLAIISHLPQPFNSQLLGHPSVASYLTGFAAS